MTRTALSPKEKQQTTGQLKRTRPCSKTRSLTVTLTCKQHRSLNVARRWKWRLRAREREIIKIMESCFKKSERIQVGPDELEGGASMICSRLTTLRGESDCPGTPKKPATLPKSARTNLESPPVLTQNVPSPTGHPQRSLETVRLTEIRHDDPRSWTEQRYIQKFCHLRCGSGGHDGLEGCWLNTGREAYR